MSGRGSWHVRRRDLPFLVFVALALACIAAFLAIESGHEPTGGGWRRIDRESLERRIESGELSGREALWYRPVLPADGERDR